MANAITQFDHAVYKAYTAKLKELYRVVLAYGLSHQPQTKGPMADALDNAEVKTLMYKLSARTDKQAPPELFVGDSDELPRIDLDRLRYFGGARTREVLDALEQVVPAHGSLPLSAAFNELDPSLRREVELAGLMRYALVAGVPVEQAARAVYRCVDLEGNERRWEAPDMMLVKQELRNTKERFDA